MTSWTDGIVKDYLFIAILLSFLVYKLPVSTKFVNGETMSMNFVEYQQKEVYLLNSILESGVRLLDIKLELESSLLDRSSDLVALIRFDSFGNVPTLINMDYTVLDSKGVEVYKEVGSVTVETEKLVSKDFKKLNLKQGKYSLVLGTLYNTDVKDEFRQDFEVKGMSALELISWTILILGIIGIGARIVYQLIKSKQAQSTT